MRSLKLYWVLFLALIIGTSCSDIDGLSDANSVEMFKIVSHSEGFELGEVFFENDSVVIPIIYGKYEFPLSINVEIETSKGIDKIMGVDFSRAIVFQTMNSKHPFQVVAESGKTNALFIVLRDMNSNEQNDIKSLRVRSFSDRGAVYASDGVVIREQSKVRVWAYDYNYPLTLNAEVTKSDSAEFEDFQSPGDLSFSSNVADTIRVIALSGKRRAWAVEVVKPTLLDTGAGLEDIERDARERLMIDPNTVTVSGLSDDFKSKYDLAETRVNNADAVIELMFKTKSSSTPDAGSPINIDFTISPYAQTMGLDVTGMSFAGLNTEKTFYVVDNIEGNARRWKVKFNKYIGNDVETFGYTSMGSEVETAGNKYTIDKTRGEIRVLLTKAPSVNPWGTILTLTLNNLTVSGGARFEGINLGTAYDFTSINDTKTFTVISEGGQSKTWTIKLQLDKIMSADNDVQSFDILYAPGYVFDHDNTTIDAKNGIIYLNMVERSLRPLELSYQMRLSKNADIEGATTRGVFVFETPAWEPTFTVIAENGLTKQWRVKLIYTPQIFGSDFNTWVNDSKERPWNPVGWATSNNFAVKGVTPSVSSDGSRSCLMSTGEVLIGERIITAGSVFLGGFKFNIEQQKKPKLMTWFGIPFISRPRSMSFDYNYSSPGADQGSAIVKLLNYEGDAPIEFHDWDGYNGPGITVIAEKTVIIGISNGWQKQTMVLDYLPNVDKKVTHIHVVFSSSSKGDSFIGVKGSTLNIDNVKLNYR